MFPCAVRSFPVGKRQRSVSVEKHLSAPFRVARCALPPFVARNALSSLMYQCFRHDRSFAVSLNLAGCSLYQQAVFEQRTNRDIAGSRRGRCSKNINLPSWCGEFSVYAEKRAGYRGNVCGVSLRSTGGLWRADRGTRLYCVAAIYAGYKRL